MTEHELTAAPRSKGKSTHYPALDGLRGLAVLGTLMLHYEVRAWPYRTGIFFPTWLAISHGWLGVEGFFVLSGFLITGILYDAKGGSHYWRNYYVRRTLRIFPLYYLALTLIFVVLPRVGGAAVGAPAVPGATQLWFWTYTQNILIALRGYGASPRFAPHFWTLSVEEQFYLLWPIAVFLLDRRQLLRVALAGVVLSTGLRIAAFAMTGDYVHGWMLTPARLDGLAFGAFCAVLIRGHMALTDYRAPARRLAMALLATVLVMEVWRHRVSPDDAVIGTIGLTIWSALMACVVMLAVASKPRDIAPRLMSFRPLRVIGKYSYGMYVWHYMIFVALQARGFTPDGLERYFHSTWRAHAAFLIVNGGATFIAAYASWHLFEKHFLKLKEHFPSKAPRSSGDGAAGATVGRASWVDDAQPAKA